MKTNFFDSWGRIQRLSRAIAPEATDRTAATSYPLTLKEKNNHSREYILVLPVAEDLNLHTTCFRKPPYQGHNNGHWVNGIERKQISPMSASVDCLLLGLDLALSAPDALSLLLSMGFKFENRQVFENSILGAVPAYSSHYTLRIDSECV